MRHPWLILGVTLLVTGTATVATPRRPPAPPVRTPATNLADFDFILDKLRHSYAGFELKTEGARGKEFEALVSRLRAEAGRAPAARVEDVLKRLVDWFEDRHTQVRALTADGQPPAPIAPRRHPELNEAAVLRLWQARGGRRHPAEGIWTIGDRYRLALVRPDPQRAELLAVFLSGTAPGWRAGMEKARFRIGDGGGLTGTYLDGGMIEHRLGAKLDAGGDLLTLDGMWGRWSRIWPAPADPDRAARLLPVGELFLRPLSPKTLWLRIPDFNDSRAKPLADLIEKHRSQIEASDNLVIDTRDNGGGSDYVYEPLIPLIYTRPYTSIGIELKSSPDNIVARQRVADSIRAMAPDQAENIERQNRLMAANPGKYIQPNPLPFMIVRLGRVLPRPKRIVILIDNAGSTGEQFLLMARQSRKVTLMGKRNSAGVLDFANVVRLPTPSGRFEIQWATSRSMRLPAEAVDPDGIPPDVLVPANVEDPVRFAQQWLERQVD